MASFTDLSNELIIAIGSHIRKPAHSLKLVLLDRQTHRLIKALLYEHIVLHPNDYPVQTSFENGYEVRRSNIARLSATLVAKSGLRSVVRTFEMGLDVVGIDGMRDFATLLTRVTSLRRFRPLGVSSTRPGSALPYAVVWSLDRVSETLESLDLSSSD